MTIPANDNYYRALVGDGSDLSSPIRYLPHEQRGIQMQKRRLAKLDAKRPNWMTPPVNDNQAWPLAQQLRKEGNDVLLRVAERYRAIYDAAQIEVPLMGTAIDDLYSVPKDQRIHNRADGSVGYKGERRVKSAVGRFEGDDGAYKATPIDDEVQQELAANVVTFPRKPKRPVPKKWNGDRLLNEAIDCRAAIHRLRQALGPLVGPFEDAVLHGETLSSIGEAQGAAGIASRGAAGRVLVMLGLQAVREAMAEMERTA